MILGAIRIQIKVSVRFIIDSVQGKDISKDVQMYIKRDEKVARAVALVAIWDTWEQRNAAVESSVVTFAAARTSSRLFFMRL